MSTVFCGVHFVFTQPVADEPFTFETELDDLPKEKLKCKIYRQSGREISQVHTSRRHAQSRHSMTTLDIIPIASIEKNPTFS